MNLIKLGLIFFFIQQSTAQGARIDPLDGVRCAAQAKMKAVELKSSAEWVKYLSPNSNELAFRSPTKKIGSWLEVRRIGKEAQLYLIDTKITKKFRWSKDCNESAEVVGKGTPVAKSKGNLKFFLDSDLEKLIKKNKAGVIYFWSPGFVYSMKHFENIQDATKELKLPLTVLMDPTIPEERAKQMAKEYNMPFHNERVESIDILMRGLGDHYPATLVYSGGKISRNLITGVEEKKIFVQLVKDELSRLK